MKKDETKKQAPWEGHSGTHANMVVKDHKDGTVTAQDEKGCYRTKERHVDNGLTDEFRQGNREKLGTPEPVTDDA